MEARRVVIVAWMAMVGACGWFADDAPHFTDAVEISAPWAELALPLEGAKVTFSDTETVSVHHTGSDAAALAARYGASLGAAGWKLEHDGSAGGIVSQTWNKGDDSMSLTMQPRDDLLVVSLAVLAF